MEEIFSQYREIFHVAIGRIPFRFPVFLLPSPALAVPDESHDTLHKNKHHKGQQKEANYVG